MNDHVSTKKCPYSGLVNTAVFHWLMQRASAVALIPLPLWTALYLKQLVHATQPQIVAWLATPLHGLFLAITALAVVYHAVLGMQVILDDYVHDENYKAKTMWLVKWGLLVLLGIMLITLVVIGAKG